MPAISRRSFLERLSLGAGAVVLGPTVNTLVAEAQGTLVPRKRFIVVTFSNGVFGTRWFPRDFSPPNDNNNVLAPLTATEFTMPDVLKPLEPYRRRMLIVDGPMCRIVTGAGDSSSGHYGWMSLTGVPKLPIVSGVSADARRIGGKSLDQHLAPVLAKGAPFSDVHVGAHTSESAPGTEKPLANHVFARGPDQYVPVMCEPSQAFSTLFPVSGATDGKPDVGLLQKRRLVDALRDDVKRLAIRLAATERNKLDEYLESLEQAQRQVAALEQRTFSCRAGAPPQPGGVEADDKFEAQMEIATSAVICGMTNLATVSFVGLGPAFKRRFNSLRPLHHVGHRDSGTINPALYLTWYSELVAKMIGRLSAVREGDRTIFDNATIMFVSDNLEEHHAQGHRIPVVFLGDAGGKLKADGRYVRFGTFRQFRKPPDAPPGYRAYADLLSTLSHVFDAPVNDWGKQGPYEPVKGPIHELLA